MAREFWYAEINTQKPDSHLYYHLKLTLGSPISWNTSSLKSNTITKQRNLLLLVFLKGTQCKAPLTKVASGSQPCTAPMGAIAAVVSILHSPWVNLHLMSRLSILGCILMGDKPHHLIVVGFVIKSKTNRPITPCAEADNGCRSLD